MEENENPCEWWWNFNKKPSNHKQWFATNLLNTNIVHLKGNQLHLHTQIIYTYIAHIVYIFLHLFTWWWCKCFGACECMCYIYISIYIYIYPLSDYISSLQSILIICGCILELNICNGSLLISPSQKKSNFFALIK